VSSPKDLDHEEIDLVGLLAGELDRSDTIATGRHLSSCSACRDELVDLAIAHGTLAGSAHALTTLYDDQAISRGSSIPEIEMVGGDAGQLPNLAVDTSSPGQRSTRMRSRSLVALSAAAAFLLVVVIGAAALRSDSSSSGRVVASAALSPISAPASAGGSVTALAIGNTRKLTVDTRNLASPPGQRFYEVWLLNPSTKKMLPVGVLPPSGAGTYSMNASIMAGYSAVDVSLQSNNGNPAHSGTSVLRAVF
jgi:hypothetical protein